MSQNIAITWETSKLTVYRSRLFRKLLFYSPQEIKMEWVYPRIHFNIMISSVLTMVVS